MPQRRKKDKSCFVRLPDQMKRLIEVEAHKSYRDIQDEIVVLISEALHMRNFNIRDFL